MNKIIKTQAPGIYYFCKPAALNLLQLLRLEVFLYISGLKFRFFNTSDFFSRPYYSFLSGLGVCGLSFSKNSSSINFQPPPILLISPLPST